MLTVYIDEIRTQRFEHGRRYRTHIDAAHAAPFCRQLALDANGSVILRVQAQFFQLALERCGNIFKYRTDKAFFCAAANEFAAGALSQNRADGINNNGFAGTRLACQHGKSRLQNNVCLFNDSNVFNVKQT